MKAIAHAGFGALAMGFGSCGQGDVQAQASNVITCVTRWRGELPLGDSEIILQACLAEGLCSRPLTSGRGFGTTQI